MAYVNKERCNPFSAVFNHLADFSTRAFVEVVGVLRVVASNAVVDDLQCARQMVFNIVSTMTSCDISCDEYDVRRVGCCCLLAAQCITIL